MLIALSQNMDALLFKISISLLQLYYNLKDWTMSNEKPYTLKE